MTSEGVLVQPLRKISAALKAGEISPVELLDQLFVRLAATEHEVKAYTVVQEEDARREGERAAAELRSGDWKGVLHGIPISLKDLIDTAGTQTTYGSPIFRNYTPREDASVVTKLRNAGALILGKTNTHEFALGATTPPTRNPFDLDRIPGGSSGGSAAAVASGSALATLGTDTGGSIRIPASHCGVVGLKPTFGLVGRSGVFPESWSLDHVGPIVRHVEDAAVLLNTIAGFDPRDPASRDAKPPDFLVGIDGGLEGIRVGVPANCFFEGLDHSVASATRGAVQHLATCGATICEVTFPKVEEIFATFSVIDMAETASNHRRMFSSHADQYLPGSRAAVEAGLLVSAATYIDALRARPSLVRAVLEAMNDVDVVVTPTQPMLAPEAGTDIAIINGNEEDLLTEAMRLVAGFNLTGQPAISVCCGFGPGNLPIGLQVVGKPFRDDVVLRVAHTYQVTTAWLEPLLTAAVPPRTRLGSTVDDRAGHS